MDKLCCFNSSYSQLVGGRSSSSAGRGKSHRGFVKYGFSLVKGKANHPMEDYHVAKFVQIKGHEIGLFAIYDGHLGDGVPAYLQKHLFSNILKEEEFWVDPNRSISKAYERTDQAILSHSSDLGRGGSTAVTAILKNRRLWVANVGDSRAVLSRGGQAMQMTIDHEPNTEMSASESSPFLSLWPYQLNNNMDSTKRVAKADQEQERRQVLSPSSSGRRRCRNSASNSPEFEFWMVRNPSFPQPNLLSADELFVDGVLLPLHLLHPSNHHHQQQQQPDPPDLLPSPPSCPPDPEPEISPASITAAEPTAANTSSLSSSKRWTDILFKKGEKKTGSASGTGKKNQEDKDREKKREKKSHSRGSSSAELNIINIWPFSRSRSAGNSGSRPTLFPAGTRKASSAPCSRSNSSGESKSSRKWPSSPGRPGVHLGRSSPVWQVRRSGRSSSNVRSNGFQFNHHDPLPGVGGRSGEKWPSKKEVSGPYRSKSSSSGGGGSNNDGTGGGGSKVKAKALKMNVPPPMCVGFRNQLSCGSEENRTIGVDGRSNRGEVKNGNTGSSGNNINYLGIDNGNGNGNGNGDGGHIFNLRTLFAKKKGLLVV